MPKSLPTLPWYSILPSFSGDLTGGEDQVAGAHPADVVGDRLGRPGKLDAELFQAIVDLAHLKSSAVSQATRSAGRSPRKKQSRLSTARMPMAMRVS